MAPRLLAGFLPRRLTGQHGGPVRDRRQGGRAPPARRESVEKNLEFRQELRLQVGAVFGAGLVYDPLPERRQADSVLHELRAAGAACKAGEPGGERPARPLSGQGLLNGPGSLQRVGLTGPCKRCLQAVQRVHVRRRHGRTIAARLGSCPPTAEEVGEEERAGGKTRL